MARIRSVKPEFFDDPDMADQLSLEERLVYIGLWTMCYDNWTMEYDPRRVRRTLFGYDEAITDEMVAAWVDNIVNSGRGEYFDFDGHTCLYLPKCSGHQIINRPSKSPIPQPSSVNTHGVLSDDSRTEGLGLMVKELGEELGEGDARATSFDECWSAYPVHRYRANAEAEFDTAIESGVSAESILTACKRVPRTHTQTLGFFIADGTWLDYAVKTKPPAEPCPDCDNGWVLEGETAVPCPKCAVPS